MIGGTFPYLMQITLICLIEGNVPATTFAFSIETEHDSLISVLKKKIKEEKQNDLGRY